MRNGYQAARPNPMDSLGPSHLGSRYVPVFPRVGRNMSPPLFSRYGNQFQAWCGLLVGVCVVLPPLMRAPIRGGQGWTGLDIAATESGHH